MPFASRPCCHSSFPPPHTLSLSTTPKATTKGQGNYVYPTDSVYKAGSFDLTRLSVKKSGAQAEFAVDVNSSLEDPWGMGNGFSVQMIFIFIKTGAGGHSEGLPGLNVQFAPGSEWNKVVILSPQKKARVMGEAQTKAAKLVADIVVPNSTRGSNRTIKGSVPLERVGWRRQRRCLVVSGDHAIQ